MRIIITKISIVFLDNRIPNWRFEKTETQSVYFKKSVLFSWRKVFIN